jgi:hypothetical protein
MDEVAQTLESMTSSQLVAALVFTSGYVLAIGHLATPRWRAWGGVCAAAAALVFVLLADPWVYGAMLVAMALGGMGLFIAMAWLGSFAAHRWAARSHAAAPPAAEVSVVEAAHAAEPEQRGASRPPLNGTQRQPSLP